MVGDIREDRIVGFLVKGGIYKILELREILSECFYFRDGIV